MEWDKFKENQELWDEFYDYVGQDLFDRIKCGEIISNDELLEWGCISTNEFVRKWRGNSEEEFQKWLKMRGGK